jgi:hypothetical protein
MPSGAFQQAIKAILDNYSDVIEGGNTWNSGTSFRGIPGRQSNDNDLRQGNDTPITMTHNGSTTTAKYTSGDWEESRWVKNDTPGYFLLCTSATNAANVNAARRITGWNNTTSIFTVDAFPAATTASDVFTVLQGFKRLPNQLAIELEDGGPEHGYDRMFTLSAIPGAQLDYFGAGKISYKTTLELTLRILKYGREHDAIASAFENLAIIRGIITKGASPDHRDGTYTRALISTGEAMEIVTNDTNKIVAVDKYILIYRLDTTFN